MTQTEQTTTPSGAPEVDVLIAFNRMIDCARALTLSDDFPDAMKAVVHGDITGAIAAWESVRALIAREAALVAERDALKDERDQLNSDYLTAINAANVLAAENKALKADCWNMVATARHTGNPIDPERLAAALARIPSQENKDG